MKEIDISGFVSRLNEKMRAHDQEAKALTEKNGEPLTFRLEPHEYDLYLKFQREHRCQFYDDGSSPSPPAGAIGGTTSIEFTLTSIGTAVSVKCACGVEENITDYDIW